MPQTRLKALQKFLERETNDSFTRYALAMEYVSLKDVPQAITNLKELLEHDSAYISAYHQLGILYQKTGIPIEAVKILEKGIELAEHLGESHAQNEMQELLDEIVDSDL
jgi:Tfp pilus assembly protein PilF